MVGFFPSDGKDPRAICKTLCNGSESSFYVGPDNLEEFFNRGKLTIADMVDAPKDEQIY